MLNYSLLHSCKKWMHGIFGRLSPKRGLSRYFPFVRSWGEWTAAPPCAPDHAKAVIRTETLSFELWLKEKDPTISARMYADHVWEANQTRIFERMLRPGDGVLDVGANIGYYSVIAGQKTGPAGKVFALEPDPSNLQVLRRNIELNGLQTVVEILPFAAGERDETRTLYGSREHDTSDRTLFSSGDIARVAHEVQTINTESYLRAHFPRDYESIRIVKMDIEGFEPYAITGLKELMQRSQTLLFTEINYRRLRQAGSSAKAYLEILSGFGFHFYLIDQKTKVPAGILKKIEACDIEQDRENHQDILCSKEIITCP